LDTELLKLLTQKQEKELTDFKIEEQKKNQEKLDQETKAANEKMRKQAVTDAEIKILQAKDDLDLAYNAQRELLEAQRMNEIQHAIETGESLLLIDEEFKQKRVDLEKKYSDEKIAQREREFNAIISLEEGIVNVVAGIGNLAIKNEEKATKFKANLTYASLLLDSAKAIGSVVAAAASTSITPVDLAIKIATGVGVVLTNIKTAIDTFKKAKVGTAPTLTGAGGSGGGGGTGNTSSVVTRPQGDQTTTGQFFDDDKPQLVERVVVLETETLTNSQKRLADIVKRSEV